MRLESTPELVVFRKKVRAFVAEHAPGVKTHAGVRAPEPELMPAIREWTAKLYEAGFLGINWPAEYGGRPDAHPLEPFVVAEEIARARTWPPVGASALASAALIEFGTDEQRARFLPRIRTCEDVWCQLFSEPGAGSDLAALQTRARPDGDVSTLGSDAGRMILQPCVAPEVVEALGAGMDGVQVFSSFDASSDDTEAQLYRQVMKQYSPDTPIEGYGAVGYQGALGLVRALEGLTGEVTPATVAAAVGSAKDVVLPAGHGNTFTCDASAIPGLKSVCSAKGITGTMTDGKLDNVRTVDPTSLLAQ